MNFFFTGSQRTWFDAQAEGDIVEHAHMSEQGVMLEYETHLAFTHVALRRMPSGQFNLVDLQSRNGVYVNGVKVHSAVLHDGDSVQMGSILFVFHEGRASS